jgi:hypothetical protein
LQVVFISKTVCKSFFISKTVFKTVLQKIREAQIMTVERIKRKTTRQLSEEAVPFTESFSPDEKETDDENDLIFLKKSDWLDEYGFETRFAKKER